MHSTTFPIFHVFFASFEIVLGFDIVDRNFNLKILSWFFYNCLLLFCFNLSLLMMINDLFSRKWYIFMVSIFLFSVHI